MALIECSTCKGSGQVRNPKNPPKDTPKGSIKSGNGPKETHLDARSKEQLKARTKAQR